MIVSEPSGANASAETTPPGKPSTRSPSSQTSLSPPRLTVQARRCALRIESDDLDVGVVGRQELGIGALPQHGQSRELAPGVAGAEHGAVRQQAGRVEGDLALVRGEMSQLAARGIDQEEVVVEGRVRALHEDAVLRPVGHVRPPARLGQLAPPAAGDADDRDVEVDAVAARVRECDERPVGRNAPGTWIALGVVA